MKFRAEVTQRPGIKAMNWYLYNDDTDAELCRGIGFTLEEIRAAALACARDAKQIAERGPIIIRFELP